MRKLALAVMLMPLCACSSFGWEGRGGGVTEDQKARGLQDVASLAGDYETEAFYRGVRRRMDGRNNALGRDLTSIQDFIDRHVWNYNKNDPYVNYPSDTTSLGQFARFGISTVATLPLVDEVVK